MKTKFPFTLCLFLSLIVATAGNDTIKEASGKNTITVLTTSGMKNLSESFIQHYGEENPEIKIELNELTAREFEGQLQPGCFVIASETEISNSASERQNRIVIGREVFVPVFNPVNPFFSHLIKNGVQPDKLSSAISGIGSATWESLLGLQNETNSPVHFYFLNDTNLTSAFAIFLKVSPTLFTAMKLDRDALIEKVESDQAAIGFVRLADLLDSENKLISNLQFLPFDRNENGQLDYNEKIYSNVNEFKRGVWIGKYPQSLINNIYAITGKETNNPTVAIFLNWIVTEGQKWIESDGVTELVYNERQLKLEKINAGITPVNTGQKDVDNLFLIIVIAVVVVAVSGFVVFLFFFRTGKIKKVVLKAVPQLFKTLNEETFEIPNGLFFDKSHTWIFMEKDGQVKIGIDDFIPKVTGKLTRIIMKNPGCSVKRKEPVVQLIQHGKQITIYSPVSGIITDINEDLVISPDTINNSPYENGWIYQIRPSNWIRETEFFKLGLQYRDWINSELNRLKDFVACSHNLQLVPGTAVAFQEGGEITAQPLKEMSPEVWEDFQTYFIDTADMY